MAKRKARSQRRDNSELLWEKKLQPLFSHQEKPPKKRCIKFDAEQPEGHQLTRITEAEEFEIAQELLRLCGE